MATVGVDGWHLISGLTAKVVCLGMRVWVGQSCAESALITGTAWTLAMSLSLWQHCYYYYYYYYYYSVVRLTARLCSKQLYI